MKAARTSRCQAAGALCGLLFLLLPLAVCAASAGFHVAVQMASTSQGSCASGPLTETADFQVMCTSGQFVSILPLSAHALVGTPGRIFRLSMMGSSPAPARSTPNTGSREPPLPVTAMRVSSSLGSTTGPVEILVSF